MKLEESLYPVAMAMSGAFRGPLGKEILDHGYSPEDIFISKTDFLSGGILSESRKTDALRAAEAELDFMRRHHITPIVYGEDSYPFLLAESANPPIVLFMIGDTDLNPEYSLSIVGTRRSTPSGEAICERLTKDFAQFYPDMLIVSGLAYGIDASAHKGALASGLPTAAVLAHGLDMIYPAAHRGLASMILQNGGALLTEYPHGVKPLRGQFLDRNRIVATMTSGVILVESPERGGAMSTASIASSYSREVMAVPGRPTDIMSRGSNLLIKTSRARLIENAGDVFNIMKWEKKEQSSSHPTPSLFPELEGETALVYDFLKTKSSPVGIDSISLATSVSVVKLTSLLMDMEFDGLVCRYPGNRYEALG